MRVTELDCAIDHPCCSGRHQPSKYGHSPRCRASLSHVAAARLSRPVGLCGCTNARGRLGVSRPPAPPPLKRQPPPPIRRTDPSAARASERRSRRSDLRPRRSSARSRKSEPPVVRIMPRVVLALGAVPRAQRGSRPVRSQKENARRRASARKSMFAAPLAKGARTFQEQNPTSQQRKDPLRNRIGCGWLSRALTANRAHTPCHAPSAAHSSRPRSAARTAAA